MSKQKTNKKDKNKWIIAGASVIGQGHIKDEKPCQDAHCIQMIDDEWGVAVVCDGAGSAAYSNSHLGSQFVSETTAKLLAALVKKEDWNKKGKKRGKSYLPNTEEWNTASIDVLKQVKEGLAQHAKEQNLEIKTLACTVIALVFSPDCILSIHIGDGRAGYCTGNGTEEDKDTEEWDSAITPFKGEQVGETVFITSDFDWEDKKYVETRVIEKPIQAFTLLTDGLEWYCWECNTKLPDEEKFIDPNKPFAQFFKANTATVKKIGEQVSYDELQEKWRGYLAIGHPKIKEEQDDKTMVLGVLK